MNWTKRGWFARIEKRETCADYRFITELERQHQNASWEQLGWRIDHGLSHVLIAEGPAATIDQGREWFQMLVDMQVEAVEVQNEQKR